MATKIGCFVIFLYSSLSQRTIAKPTCLTGLPHLFQTFSHMAKYWKVKVKYIQIAKPNRKDGKKSIHHELLSLTRGIPLKDFSMVLRFAHCLPFNSLGQMFFENFLGAWH